MAERVYQGIVAVSTIARAKQVADQQVQLAIAKTAKQVGEELFLLLRSDVVKWIERARPLRALAVLLLIDHARVVEDDHRDGMAIAAEVFVVGFNSLADFPQAVGRDDKAGLVVTHRARFGV